ncbi:MAG TPA: peptidoglycan DD-metalloendopeptidase family protein [Pseudomonadota bacterium]|nr:peptidoglycan DD-metalloendopeptidase family protein [Pseudomonadota bacterium]HRA37102.1 peptidoglycan DD-metalloendopeptidase family protein [Pseudomonadota bacterium]
MNLPPNADHVPSHPHRRQAVRRQAQHRHWRFYLSRANWHFIPNFARAPIDWRNEHLVIGAAVALLLLLGFVVLPGWASAARVELAPAAGTLSSQAIALPPQARVSAAAVDAAPAWTYVEVKPGQTMGDIFDGLGLKPATLHAVLARSSHRDELVKIRPGERFGFKLAAPGKLEAVEFDAGDDRRVTLEVGGAEVRESVAERALQRRVGSASGTITHSLFGAGEKAGLDDSVILKMAEVFGYDIDFAQDLRRGDHFAVIYDEVYRDGERLRSGDILAATFVNGGKRYVALRHPQADGTTGYYDAEGRPLKKAFLRTPVEFSRISSRFSSARRHPILGSTRAHRGVDYAAPKGTPIRTAGNGRVIFRGWKSGYGNCVIVQHPNNVTTLYAHMSRFAPGRGVGTRVSQGEVVGYVGMTGLATAPHLHYEFRVGGVHRDPLTVPLPKAEPLGPAELLAFRRSSTPVMARLTLIEQREPAASALAAR